MYVKMSNLSTVRKVLSVLDKMGYYWINGERLLPWWDKALNETDRIVHMRRFYLSIQNNRCVAFSDIYTVACYEKDAVIMTDIEYIESLCSKEKYFILNKEV